MSEQITEIAVRHQSHIERLKNGEAKRVTAFAEKLEREILGKLSGENLTAWGRARLERQLKEIGSLIDDLATVFIDSAVASLSDFAEYEAEFEARALASVVDSVKFATPAREQVIQAVFSTPLGDIGGINSGELLEPFLRELPGRSVKRITGAIRAGYATGRTNQEIIRDVVGVISGGKNKRSANTIRREAEAIVRTAMQHSASVARESTWQKNSRVIKGVKIVASLDSRTSDICRSIDGTVYPVSEGPRPPFHINCRTTTRAVLADKYSALSEGGTRAAREPDGSIKSVDADETYYGWLKKQPAGVQDSIIGDARGKLLRNGGLSAERFASISLTDNFKAATLDEMRALEPAAFEKAGI